MPLVGDKNALTHHLEDLVRLFESILGGPLLGHVLEITMPGERAVIAARGRRARLKPAGTVLDMLAAKGDLKGLEGFFRIFDRLEDGRPVIAMDAREDHFGIRHDGASGAAGQGFDPFGHKRKPHRALRIDPELIEHARDVAGEFLEARIAITLGVGEPPAVQAVNRQGRESDEGQ
jgi:hypothetical protein